MIFSEFVQDLVLQVFVGTLIHATSETHNEMETIPTLIHASCSSLRVCAEGMATHKQNGFVKIQARLLNGGVHLIAGLHFQCTLNVHIVKEVVNYESWNGPGDFQYEWLAPTPS